MKFEKFLGTPFFTEHLRWLQLAMGAPYLFSKVRGYIFYYKIELHLPGIFAAILKKFYFRNAFHGTYTFGVC